MTSQKMQCDVFSKERNCHEGWRSGLSWGSHVTFTQEFSWPESSRQPSVTDLFLNLPNTEWNCCWRNTTEVFNQTGRLFFVHYFFFSCENIHSYHLLQRKDFPEESICNFKLMQSGNDATGTADMKQFYRNWKIKAVASLCVQIIQQISHLLPKLATESWQSSWQWAVYREYPQNDDTTLQPKKKMCCYLRRLKVTRAAYYQPAAGDRLFFFLLSPIGWHFLGPWERPDVGVYSAWNELKPKNTWGSRGHWVGLNGWPSIQRATEWTALPH